MLPVPLSVLAINVGSITMGRSAFVPLPNENPTVLPFKVARPMLQNGHLEAVGESGQTGLSPERVAVTGKRADGSPLQAQLAWIADGTNLYQIAVYGPRLTPDMVETLFSEIRIQ